VAATVLVAVSGPLAACSSSSGTTGTTGSPTNTPSSSTGGGAAAVQQAFIQVVNRIRPSVVEITTDSGLGSGVVYDGNGDIVTNDHVVGSATRLSVTNATGRTFGASVVGTFPPDDLAVVRVEGGSGMTAATFGSSSKLQVGEMVMAVGNPLGLQSSVTNGIVSATGRTVSESGGVVLPQTIQTSAPINPGNSGGALVDLNSAVVGIPTLAATDPQLGGGAAPGIGFAIPSDTVKLIASQLISQGKVTNSGRAALGVRTTTGFDQSGQPAGVIIVSVTPGSPAANAGLQAGEVISAVNGTKTPTSSALADALAGFSPGQKVQLSVIDLNGSQTNVSVTLGNLSGS
jgi:putative serine protease PepD